MSYMVQRALAFVLWPCFVACMRSWFSPHFHSRFTIFLDSCFVLIALWFRFSWFPLKKTRGKAPWYGLVNHLHYYNKKIASTTQRSWKRKWTIFIMAPSHGMYWQSMWGQVIEFNGSGFASWCFGATNLMDGPGGGVVAVLLQSSETLKREADMRTRAQS